ncbi:MAG: serine/threonine-protein kinase [Planctomycetota bacterium]|nr:serine/threonine-protein kinase [Planctomycetota bacterium]
MTRRREEQIQVGLVAVQEGLITDAVFLSAVGEWLKDNLRSLDEVLLAQDSLSLENKKALVDLFGANTPKYVDPTKQEPRREISNEDIDKIRPLLDKTFEFEAAEPEDGERTTPYVHAVDLHEQTVENRGERNRFRIIKPHKKGGLGVISIAQDLQLNRTVALKQILGVHANSGPMQEKFYQEAEVTGQLEHPSIVPIYALGVDDQGKPFYAMRFVSGVDLLQRIREFHSAKVSPLESLDGIPLRQLLQRFLDVCNAIEFAHSRGVLHRDLKPANIMLGSHGETLVVDWGLAKVMPNHVVGLNEKSEVADPSQSRIRLSGLAGQTKMGDFAGTVAYSAPEQLTGQISLLCPQSDVFSLGAILYELLTGVATVTRRDEKLGTAEFVAQVFARIKDGLVPLPSSIHSGVPKPLEAICCKAMSFAIGNRYASAKELSADVERWLADERVLAYAGREPLVEQAGRLLRRHRSWTVAIGTSLVLVTLLTLVASYWVNRARLAESQAKTAANEFKSDAVDRYRIAKEAIDILTVGSDSLKDFPATKNLQKRFLQAAATDYKKLSQNTSQDPELELERVRALVRLGDISHLQEKVAEAHEHYQTAISLLKDTSPNIEKLNPNATLSTTELSRAIELGRIYSRIGLARDNEGNVMEARNEFDRAIALFRSLETKHATSDWLSVNLAVALSNRGSMEQRQRNNDDAIKWLQESIEFFDRAYAAGEARFVLNGVRTRESLGRAFRELGQKNKADSNFDQAETTLSDLIASDMQNPEYLEAQASLFISRAVADRGQGALRSATAKLDDAAKTYEQLREAWPDSLDYVEQSAIVFLDQGHVLLEQGEATSASEKFKEAGARLRKLSEDYPTVPRFQEELAAALSGLGQSQTEFSTDLDDAKRSLDECVSIIDGLRISASDGRVLREYVELQAVYMSQYAQTLYTIRELEQSGELFDKCIANLERVTDNQSSNAARDNLANVYWRSGLLEYENLQKDIAVQRFEKAIEMWKFLSEVNRSPVYSHRLADCYLQCPEVSLRDYSAALELAKLSYGDVGENRTFACTYADALIRNNKANECALVLEEIKDSHGSWNACDYVVQAKLHIAQNEPGLAKQSIELAQEWAAKNRPMNLDLQRQIRETISQSLGTGDR